MKRHHRGSVVKGLFVAAFVLCLTGTALGFGHYTPGVEGINAGSAPPPGFHYSIYNLFYTADTLTDAKGRSMNPDPGFDLSVFAMAHRFTYITDVKILGADYGFDAIVPLVRTDLSIDARGFDDDSFEIGDICVEPLILGWHTPRWDVTAAIGFYAPTGSSSEPTAAGKGHWSVMESLGATYYFDDARTTSFSLLTRWLQNGEIRETGVTPGADMVAEYGLGKMFPLSKTSNVSVGLVGYSYSQLDETSGDGPADTRYSGHAVGPEIRGMLFQPFPMQVSARCLFEYATENSTEGQSASLTLIGSF